MNLKTLLVHVDHGRGCAARLRAAARLARTHEARLVGFYDVPGFSIPVYVDTAVPADLLETQRRKLAARAAAAQQVFEDAVRDGGVHGEWRAVEGRLATDLTRHARYADLVVCGQADGEDPECAGAGLAEALVLESGRPVLVVPYVGPRETLGERVLVAWNATREAARAVWDALPLLVRAAKVDVIVVNPPGEERDLSTELCQYLARHGVAATAQQIPGADIEVGDIFLSRAADLGSDLIVMGGYGHSRFRELILGGATRSILAHMTVPTLFSH